MKNNIFGAADLLAGVLSHDCAGAQLEGVETTLQFVRAQREASNQYYAGSDTSLPGGTGAWTATIYGGDIDNPVVTHETGTGRLKVTMTAEKLSLTVSAGVKNLDGSVGAKVMTLEFDGLRWKMTHCNSSLIEGRYDRLDIVAELDYRLFCAGLPSIYIDLERTRGNGWAYDGTKVSDDYNVVIKALDILEDALVARVIQAA